jgi:hypothetical protein
LRWRRRNQINSQCYDGQWREEEESAQQKTAKREQIEEAEHVGTMMKIDSKFARVERNRMKHQLEMRDARQSET